MRSINTIEWFAGREALPMNTVSLKNTVFARAFKFTLQMLVYIPAQFDRYLDKLDANPVNSRQQVMQKTREGLRTGRQQNIPTRVWQRRSALLTMLEEQKTVLRNQADSKYNFKVVQVQSRPVWASNFSDMGTIEQELDYFKRQGINTKAC